ncbi:MAG TPA: NHL repeat-containing protein [Steroidobacteraceae bacterium]|nr:NHL repeat-containing protein [Steroidobacteraceae bacterium]
MNARRPSLVISLIINLVMASSCIAGESSGWSGAQASQACRLCLYQPDNMAFDAQGDIYLVDTDHKHRSRILKLSQAGKKLADWRVFTDGPGSDNGPNGIAIDGRGNIYAPDGAAQRVLKLSPTGKVIQIFGPMKGSFKYVHVAVGADGDVYVVEPEQNAIEKLSPDGKRLARWHRERGSGADQWREPQTISIGKDNTLVLLDWGNDRIEILSDGGVTRRIFRAAGAPNEPLVSSSGACTDSDGGIYVADYQRNRIKEYDPAGHLVKTIGNDGSRKIFEHAPFSMACGRDGNLYSADGLSVVKYSKDGAVLARWR